MLVLGEGKSSLVGDTLNSVEAHNWLLDRSERYLHVGEDFGEAVDGDAVIDVEKEELGKPYVFWLSPFAYMDLHVCRGESWWPLEFEEVLDFLVVAYG